MCTDNQQLFPLNGTCNCPLTSRVIDCSLDGNTCNCDGDIQVCGCLLLPITMVLDSLLWIIQLPFVPCFYKKNTNDTNNQNKVHPQDPYLVII